MARRKEGQNQITKGRTMTKTKTTDTNKTNNELNKLNKQGVKFVHQFYEFVDLHSEDRTLTIIQDLHKAGHIEFKDSELDYCDFMLKEDDMKQMKFQPGMTGEDHLRAVHNLMLNSNPPEKDEELDPFQQAIEKFVNTPEVKFKLDS